jgi:hypothetical protein
MGSSLVVFIHPFFSQVSYFSDIGKKVSLKNGFAVDSVKPFDIAILHRPNWLDKLNLNFLSFAPPLKFFGNEPKAVSALIIWGLAHWTIRPYRTHMMPLDFPLK